MPCHSPVAAPENYTIDPVHTHPHWEVNHFGVSNWRGQFGKSAGKFMIDRAAKAGSVEITVQTASVISGDNDKDHGRVRSTSTCALRISSTWPNTRP